MARPRVCQPVSTASHLIPATSELMHLHNPTVISSGIRIYEARAVVTTRTQSRPARITPGSEASRRIATPQQGNTKKKPSTQPPSRCTRRLHNGRAFLGQPPTQLVSAEKQRPSPSIDFARGCTIKVTAGEHAKKKKPTRRSISSTPDRFQ